MNVIYDQRTYREMPQSMEIKQSDDAWHPLKDRNYVEWWYFDLMNSDGSIVRGQFYISGNRLRGSNSMTGVRASYVKPDSTEVLIDKKFPLSSFKASTETCDVKIGNSFIKGDLSHYTLHIEDDNKSLDLELHSLMKGFTSHACFGSESRYMYWVVPQPRCQAKGAFKTKNETFNIEGTGYRDHNWLNFPPMDYLAHWDWGRIYNEEFTILFADIVTTKKFDGAEIKPLLIYNLNKMVYLSTETAKWNLTKGDISLDPETRIGIPRIHLLNAHADGLSLRLNLQLKSVFQKIDLLADFNPIARFLISTFKAKPTITSFYSTGSGELNIEGRHHALNCTAVHEFVNNLR
ncbi:MAG: hypothetical protein FJ004_04185 [Chloroflexi bacterium]|nr:hypothetical protein [Chloroflexota bacterium]